MRAIVVQVVKIQHVRGNGTPESPYRAVTAYFNFDGTLIGEQDDYPPEVTKNKENLNEDTNI